MYFCWLVGQVICCRLCNLSSNTLLPICAGQKKLGIICINTFDIAPIIINQYDNYGNLVNKLQNNTSMICTSFGELDIII